MVREIIDDEGVNVKAALCVGFATFLRCGELTWDTWCPDSPRLHLSRKHVVFQPDGSVILTLPASKVDQFHVGVEIYLAQSPLSPLCPATALRALFNRYPAPPHAPLFIRPFRQPFDKSFFVHAVHHLLLDAGISTVDYSGHSLRKGAAVTADCNGISRHDISAWDAGKATPWTSTLTNAKSLIISGKSSVSTPSFSPLFTNLSDIVDGHANSLGLLVLLHASAVWPVETCREASLNHKTAAIHQSIFHMITILPSSNGNWVVHYRILELKRMSSQKSHL